MLLPGLIAVVEGILVHASLVHVVSVRAQVSGVLLVDVLVVPTKIVCQSPMFGYGSGYTHMS